MPIGFFRIVVPACRKSGHHLSILFLRTAIRILVNMETVQSGGKPVQGRRKHKAILRFGNSYLAHCITNAILIDQIHRYNHICCGSQRHRAYYGYADKRFRAHA